jgi:hypothetical protein
MLLLWDHMEASNKTDDSEGYKSPPATQLIINPPSGPHNRKTIPKDDNHLCPVCNGKGFIAIVDEKNVQPRIKRDVQGKMFPYMDDKK